VSADLNHCGAEFLLALDMLDAEAARDVRSRLRIARFETALIDIEAFLGELCAALGVDIG
jgi:hypothetical protein